SVAREENVTKQLYADYSAFKRKLFQNVAEQNPQYDKLLLFKKTQKLLDRFLFIFFAEDRLLLPPNSVREILQQWEDLKSKYDEYFPLYSRFKKYFGYLNVGHVGKQHEIFAYNGGLFLPDEILDSLIIDDTILFEGAKALSNYDFETDVDVNILGHIFEHSLTEIEELQQQLTSPLSAGEAPEVRLSKRKKDGVFYTPRYITKYIVENTVGALCTQQKEKLQIDEETFAPRKRTEIVTRQKLLKKIEDYRDWLLQLTICDPACGSGAFLNAALEYLKEEHKILDELTAKMLGEVIVFSDLDNSILENNLFGVDINEEATEIAKLSLWLHTAKKGRKLSTLSNNIKCGNSLIDDASVAGDKAFVWKEEFKSVFEKGGFDVVIGNPPYVRAELLTGIREYLQNTYSVFNPASDLFSYFYEKSFQLLKQRGRFGFISNAFDKTTAAVALRKWLQEKVTLINYIDFTGVQIFDGATTYPVIISAIKNAPSKNNTFNYKKVEKDNLKSFSIDGFYMINQSLLTKENWTFHDLESSTLIQKIKIHPVVKKLYGKCYYGVKTALNDAFLVPKNLFSNPEHIKPIWEGKDLQKWISIEPGTDLILFKKGWTKSLFGDIDEEDAVKRLTVLFPEIALHLLSFKDKAKARYDQGDYWWELRNCAYYDLFKHPKIVFPNLQNANKFSLDEKGIFINAPAVLVSISHLDNSINQGRFLLAILNSKLVWYFLKSICVVRSGGYIEVKPQYFEQIPIPELNINNQQPFIEKADTMLLKNQELQQLSEQFTQLLQVKIATVNINRKLENWYTLTGNEFLKEISKQKIKLPLAEQQEWLQFFEEQKTKANTIQQVITQTDAAIDQMVYALYDLSEEEIKIVEGGS
ncbi:MAG TPA: DNA methyltransferase, partial [Hanamia sp.]|nr:DNA methyltransferase [Hanamia sp.]